MPDITLCDSTECPLRLRCYRHAAKPAPHRQSYFMTPPYKGRGCDYFYPMAVNESPKDTEA